MLTIGDNASTARQSIVNEAKSWLGTPYLHMGRQRGVGADCATFIAEAFTNAGLIPYQEIEYYHIAWNLHRDRERYLEIVLQHAVEVDPRKSPPQPGDVVLWRYARTYSHGAIVINWPTIIESMMNRGVVLSDASIHRKPLRLFRHKDLFL